MKFVNSKGVTYYLHSREVLLPRNKVKARSYFFKREKGEDYLSELPIHLMIKETHTGLPIVKKK